MQRMPALVCWGDGLYSPGRKDWNRREKTGKAGSSLRRGLWLGMAIILAAPLGGSRLTLGQDDLPKSGKENNSSLSAVKMPIRRPDHAVVGRRFTLEGLITNMGTSTV